MIQEPRTYTAELLVIGTGMAGMAASVAALARGLRVIQVGNTGALAYTTGYLDLFGLHQGWLLNDPWQALELLRENQPEHPLARVSNTGIHRAFTDFTHTLTGWGIGYSAPGARNLFAPTPVGSSKPTLCTPLTMAPGIEARKEARRALILDFIGLNGFSAREFVANMRGEWPGLSAARIAFPDMDSGAEVYPEVMARAVEVPATRERLAETIAAVMGDAEAIGLPAMLGMHRPDRVHAALQKQLGVPVFEIPTMPPAVPGVRLRELFERSLPKHGAGLISQHKVERLELGAKSAVAHLKDSYGDVVIEAETVLLASGRFISGGLRTNQNSIRENLLDLPLKQPPNREAWHRNDYFDPAGHPINRAGVTVDEQFHPLDANGEPVDDRLFAAGALLADQDWIRERCGAGLAIATAYAAVAAAANRSGAAAGNKARPRP